MRKLAVVVVAIGLLTPIAVASGEQTKVRGPWALVSLASLGTVTWRCDPTASPHVAAGLPALGLGFRVADLGQTGHLTLLVGSKSIVSREIQPGEVVTLPYLRARNQRLAISEGGEDGTLRAVVNVAFAQPSVSNYCWPYMPPDVRVHLSVRH
jgi:hypothetical protein